MSKAFSLKDFPAQAYDKIRYGDTDRQGHVNNAVFATYFETGRVESLISIDPPVLSEGTSFVLASINIQLKAELLWPGNVDIGTRITRVGKSSMGVEQALFQNGRCAAIAESAIVQVDINTKRSTPFTESALDRINALMEVSYK
ncbi:MAG: acyl-CoA thioesterase [Agarilytica sp.]